MASASSDASKKFRQGTGRFDDAVSSRGFTPSKIAEDIAASGCNNPVHCIEKYQERLVSKMEGPTKTLLYDGLKSSGFFSLTEKDEGDARQCGELVKAESVGATDASRIRTLLDQVEKKTARLSGKARYDQKSPLVIFIYRLAEAENCCEFAKELRDSITLDHDCDEHAAPLTIAATPAKQERGAAAEAAVSDGRSTKTLLDMDDLEFKRATLDSLTQFSTKQDGMDCKQIARNLERKPAGAGCDSGVKKRVNKALNALVGEGKVRKNGVMSRNLPCYEIADG